MDVLDDSENDSDYVPGNSDNEEPELEERVTDNPASEIADRVRKRKVDAMWDEMVREDKKHCSEKLEKSINKSKSSQVQRKGARAANSLILASIFGKTVATSLCRDNETSALNREIVERPSKILKAKALKIAEGVLKKTKVVEVKRFAGEDVMLV
jgi:hypothetical protein